MALRGTLKDFGIADILQLINHQRKNGILAVRTKEREIRIHFETGDVVNCENSDPKGRELIGSMLLRAECITEPELTSCLEIQKQTGRQIGSLLIETTELTQVDLEYFVKLQIAESVYGLFLWTTGTYEFTQTEEIKRSGVFMRTENVLMEGLRQVDEWPFLRRFLKSYSMTFEPVAPIEDFIQDQQSDLDNWDLADTLQRGDESTGIPPAVKVGDNEVRVYKLVSPHRDVQKIVDLSRLGEFEACRSLANLLKLKAIAVVSERENRPSAHATVGGIRPVTRSQLLSPLAAGTVLVLILLGGYWGTLNKTRIQAFADKVSMRRDFGFKNTTVEETISRTQIMLLRRNLEIYRAQYGEYPTKIEHLSQQGFVSERDLSYPWRNRYKYSRIQEGYRLERPVY